jgi:hypothetical protein
MGVDPLTWSMNAYTLVLLKRKDGWKLKKTRGGYTSTTVTLKEKLTLDEAVNALCEEVKNLSVESLNGRGFKT